MSRLRVVGRVPMREWPAVTAVLAIAVAVEVGLRTMPLPRLARLLGVPLDTGEREPRRLETAPVLPLRVRTQVRAMHRVLRHWPWDDTCLRQALVIGQRLRRRGPVLRVGVARIDGEVRAHAWIEIDGVRLDPIGGAASYQVLQPVPSPKVTR